VLAYLFWHRPLADAGTESYEQKLSAFHRSLAHRPPMGLRASASFRVGELPWTQTAGVEGWGPGGAYEDWYLVEDWTALGILKEAAVGHGHRTAHDHAARAFGAGTGGVYELQEGEAGTLAGAGLAVWVSRAPGSGEPVLGELLSDGAQAGAVSLWRRQLLLGPAPEYCLLAAQAPAGVAPSRLPEGWSARTITREAFIEH
jgi:hypothetical protein